MRYIIGTTLFMEGGKEGRREEREGEGKGEDCMDSGRGNLWIINASAHKFVLLLKQSCSWQRKLQTDQYFKGIDE